MIQYFEGIYLSSQTCSRVSTPTAIHKNVKDNKLAGPDKNTNRLILGLLRKTTSPVVATGEKKSAKGPMTMRETVLEIDKSLTWCAAGEPLINCPEYHPADDGGTAITIVPIFDITISDYVKTFKNKELEVKKNTYCPQYKNTENYQKPEVDSM
jgi:hypothetical protein